MKHKQDKKQEDKQEDFDIMNFNFKRTIPYSYYYNKEVKKALRSRSIPSLQRLI